MNYFKSANTLFAEKECNLNYETRHLGLFNFQGRNKRETEWNNETSVN